MTYTFGPGSRKELQGVHPDLVGVFELALTYSPQDFGIHDGLRTVEEQREYVARGVSQTMNSMHMKQPDGYGHAGDAVPYINGKFRWEWPPIYHIAAAMKRASVERGVPVRWGGCWQLLSDIPGSTAKDMEAAVAAYGARRRAAGKKAFTDGPHFELVAR